MPPQTVEIRVQKLEQRMTRLEELPSRMELVESQIVQLRTEMLVEFSAVRAQMRSGIDSAITTIGDAIEAGRRETRVLFEEVVSRIAVLGEQRADSGRKRTKRKT